MIEIENLIKRFGGRTVLDDVSLSVSNGEILAVVGPSGAGKTTLSRCVSFLERPTSGTVRVDGKDFTRLEGSELLAARRSVGVIFQTAPLLRRRTVAENVALPMEYLGATDASIEKRVSQLLDRVGLADRRSDLPAQLSGGQKQRVGIGAVEDVILDPTSSLARELLPDRPSVPFRGSGEIWEVSYASREVPLDWLTSIHTVPGISGSRVSVLSASVEAIRGIAVGRAILAISDSAPSGFERYLKDRGLHVTAVRPETETTSEPAETAA